jgi:hypothetical protein
METGTHSVVLEKKLKEIEKQNPELPIWKAVKCRLPGLPDGNNFLFFSKKGGLPPFIVFSEIVKID